jgi:hypothetical protein
MMQACRYLTCAWLLCVLAAMQRKPSLKRPVQADGVYCLSKLEWLVHAMGHEMVHCIVQNACPKAREYDAYKADNGHGPIFMRLNK